MIRVATKSKRLLAPATKSAAAYIRMSSTEQEDLPEQNSAEIAKLACA